MGQPGFAWTARLAGFADREPIGWGPWVRCRVGCPRQATTDRANQFVVYVNGSPVYTSATGLTSLSSVTVTPGVAGPWAVNVYAYNSGYALLASGYCVPGYAATVTVVNTAGNVQLGGVIQNVMNGVGMNDAGTKIVVSDATAGKFYYSYYNGTNWIAATTISGVSNSSYYTGALTADGTRGIIGNYWFPWTGTTPGSLTSLGTAPSGGRTFTKLTADGSRLLMQAGGVMGFYTWNGTTYAGFTSLAALTNLNTNSSIAISPDGTYIAYTVGTSTAVSVTTPAVYFAKWNGTTYANETINVCSGFSSTFNGYTLNWGISVSGIKMCCICVLWVAPTVMFTILRWHITHSLGTLINIHRSLFLVIITDLSLHLDFPILVHYFIIPVATL